MVSSERDELGSLQEGRDGASLPEFGEGGCHLRQRDCIVHGRDWDIAAVNNLCPVLIGIDICSWVEAPE